MNYKGMNMDMTCQGFQYEQGKEYEHDGPVKCCPSQSDLDSGAGGFHACEYPLDVFGYYAPSGSRFFEVEQSGEMEKATDDTKVASKRIKIGAELDILCCVGFWRQRNGHGDKRQCNLRSRARRMGRNYIPHRGN